MQSTSTKLATPFLNAFAGAIVSWEKTGACAPCRILTDSGVLLSGNLFAPQSKQLDPCMGQRVLAVVAAHDVVLVAPEHRPVNEQWNQWPGRIVLVESGQETWIVTVKILGQRWTLKSMGTVLGLDRAPRVWDPVTIMIDPDKAYAKPHHPDRPSLRPRILRMEAVPLRGLTVDSFS